MAAWLGAFHARLALVTVTGLALRVLYTVLVARKLGGIGDYFFYHDSANHLAQGEGFINPFALALGPPHPTAEHPPLWPFALSVTSLLGGTGFLSHKLTGCLIGAAAIVPIGLLGRRVAGERAGLVAAALAAVYPTLIAADGSLMSETLYGFLIALALLAAYRLHDGVGTPPALALGALLGLAALTRGEALFLVVLLALPICARARAPARARVLRFAAVCAAAAVVILPWTVRNWIAFDQPVLISINDGAVLAGANCDRAWYGEDTGLWTLECAPRGRGLNEAEQGEAWRERGVEYVLDHPGRYPVVAAVRLLRVWDLWQPWRQTLAEGRHRTVQAFGTAMLYVLLPLAAWGAVLLRHRRQPLLILAAPFMAVTITALVGYGLPRFRHAAEIPLVVLAAVALDGQLARRWRGS